MKQGVCKICKKVFLYGNDCYGIYCDRNCRYKDHSSIVKKGWIDRNRIPWNKGKKLPTGEKSNRWTGDKVGYEGIHAWLRLTFGKASLCESISCKKKSIVFEWCLVRNKEYQRKRENFIQLCRSCHILYDDIPTKGWITRKKISV